MFRDRRPKASGSSARNPDVFQAATLANVLRYPPRQGVGSNTIMSPPEHAYQLARPPAQRDAAPPKDKPAQLNGEKEFPKYAGRPSAVLDFALFPDARKPVDSSASL